jgi:hypothetical protein
MNLIDYLHYYIGCDYWTNNSQGNLNAKTLPYIIEMCERNKGVQLHLRRLEDMTEEEFFEAVKIVDPDANRDDVLHYYPSFKANGISQMSVAEGDFQKAIYIVHYLLRQHFDLFNLIDAGLAVDQKTIAQ